MILMLISRTVAFNFSVNLIAVKKQVRSEKGSEKVEIFIFEDVAIRVG